VTGDPIATFGSAARSFAALVRQIPAPAWDGPGLGDWDLRSLVGHTSRSLTTVSSYLQTTADREDIASPQDYYVYARQFASQAGRAAIVERGRQAGRDLASDPAAAVDALVDRVCSELTGRQDRLIAVIGGVGIRLYAYLPTRTFEMAVHGLDIAGAAGVAFTLPAEVLDESAALAARIAVALGEGDTVLLSLTGRRTLPTPFSVT
jgi:uncharacterized protein (TIGR03083 family)